MDICGIYKFENLETHQVYIGQSKNIYQRYGAHYKDAFTKSAREKSGSKIDQALYERPDVFEFTIIEQCEENQLNERENFWIKYYNSQNNGYNVLLPKSVVQYDLNKNIIATYKSLAEAARQIKEQDSLEAQFDSIKSYLSYACKKKWTTAYGYYWRQVNLGEDLSYDNFSETRETKKGHSTAKRSVMVFDKLDNFIGMYESISEAARQLNISNTSQIGHVLHNRAKTCQGYKFKYSEDT